MTDDEAAIKKKFSSPLYSCLVHQCVVEYEFVYIETGAACELLDISSVLCGIIYLVWWVLSFVIWNKNFFLFFVTNEQVLLAELVNFCYVPFNAYVESSNFLFKNIITRNCNKI